MTVTFQSWSSFSFDDSSQLRNYLSSLVKSISAPPHEIWGGSEPGAIKIISLIPDSGKGDVSNSIVPAEKSLY